MCAIDEEKLAQNAESSSDIVIDNILHHAMGKKMHPYIPAQKIKVISLGKHDGVASFKGYWLSGFITALMKEFVEWMVMVSYQYRAGSILI